MEGGVVVGASIGVGIVGGVDVGAAIRVEMVGEVVLKLR
jgi:hypothetical protein